MAKKTSRRGRSQRRERGRGRTQRRGRARGRSQRGGIMELPYDSLAN
jgi:hypothetical protein